MSEEQHILAYLAEDGPAGWAFVARTLQTRHPTRPPVKFTLLVDMEKRGLVERSVIEVEPNIVYDITDAGRSYLERFPVASPEQRGPWLMLEHGTRPPPSEPDKAAKSSSRKKSGKK